MKISLSWLKEFIDLNASPKTISETLTDIGLEVEHLEEIESIPGGLKGLVIGEVITCEPHPNADRLKKTTVDIGEDVLSPIVCGAINVAQGQKVLVATVGATLYPSQGEPFKIKKAKIRGEVSEGMICAEDEVGLGQSHEGILVLDTHLPNGTPAAEYFNLSSDHVIEIGLTPNRADAASHYGVARDLKAAFKQDLQLPKLPKIETKSSEVAIQVEVKDTQACPRYSGLTMKNVKVAASPDWLQNRLKSIGIQPTNNVVDVTNYILHGWGQPMHAFDADAISSGKIVVQTLPEKTTFTTLDDKKRKLSAQDLMICNDNEGLCIAGVLGGLASGVTEKTTTVFLESAYFSPDSVRKTSQHHQIKTDAAFRYERGTDPEITVIALKRAAALIQELAGGEPVGALIDIYNEPVAPFNISVSYANINRLIGKDIAPEEVKEIMRLLEIEILEESQEGLELQVPSYRVDVQREADIIEEVLRLHGYNNVALKPFLSSKFLSEFPKKDNDTLQLETSRVLTGAGFSEIVTNSLTKHQYAAASKDLSDSGTVYMLNALSEELDVLRQSMLFSGLEVVAHNIRRQQKNLSLFEFGHTYHKAKKGYDENNHLALFITGEQVSENWLEKSRPIHFHDLAQTVYQILNKFGLQQTTTQDATEDYFAYGLHLLHNHKVIVSMGKVHPEFSRLCQIQQEVFYAEIDWTALKAQLSLDLTAHTISKFPMVRRDLSLVVDRKVTFEEIKKTAFQGASRLLQDLRVFDVYEGDKIGEKEKAYAISFFLQDEHQTLTDKIIDKTMRTLMLTFEQKVGAKIRQ